MKLKVQNENQNLVNNFFFVFSPLFVASEVAKVNVASVFVPPPDLWFSRTLGRTSSCQKTQSENRTWRPLVLTSQTLFLSFLSLQVSQC